LSTKSKQPTVALALGAGGARGIAHVHVFEALDDMGVRPVAIAGTSIGAIMGAAYASGMSGADIGAYVTKSFRDRAKLIADLWKLRPQDVRQFLGEGGPRLGEINIERVLNVFLPPQIPADFSQLGIPLKVVATDYYAHRDRVFQTGPLRPVLAASAAMPAVFLPVIIDGEVFIDGGTTNPASFDTLQDAADIIVVVDVTGGPLGDQGVRPRKIDVIYAGSQLMQQSIVRAKAEHYRPDVHLRPSVDAFRVLDFLKTETVLHDSKPLRDELKKELGTAIERFAA